MDEYELLLVHDVKRVRLDYENYYAEFWVIFHGRFYLFSKFS